MTRKKKENEKWIPEIEDSGWDLGIEWPDMGKEWDFSFPEDWDCGVSEDWIDGADLTSDEPRKKHGRTKEEKR